MIINKHDSEIVAKEFFQRDLIMILDAGILEALPKSFDLNNQCVLTPHIGEAAKLLNQSVDYVINNPIMAALELYKQYNTPIILKGASTIIVFNGHVSIVINGDPCLATAGSGDVLAGMLAAHIAENGFSKCIIEQVVYKHANIGKLWARHKDSNLIASDILKEI